MVDQTKAVYNILKNLIFDEDGFLDSRERIFVVGGQTRALLLLPILTKTKFKQKNCFWFYLNI
jgi:hypothetical protein